MKHRLLIGMLGILAIGSGVLRATQSKSESRQSTNTPAAARTGVRIDGVWTGELLAGDAKIHLVLHLSHGEGGGLKATLDSLDQGVYGMAADVTRTDATLRLEMAKVGVAFEGKITPDGKTIEGQWSQGNAAVPLTFRREPAGVNKPTGAVSPAEGLWQGALAANGLRLRLQLHVAHDTQSQLVAALDSLDQGVSGVPATNVSEQQGLLHFEIPAIGGTYDGTLSPGKNAITGIWKQGETTEKLDFKRSDEILAVRRPQTPIKPYPYREEEVSLRIENAQIVLAGALTLPRGPGPFPAAVLIAGSGPLDRDEFDADHRPFLVLADHLTRKGIAVLRYDKRGTGKSGGTFSEATTQDFAADAAVAVKWLAARPEIDPKRIGLIGHSEGGLIAPLVASRDASISWLVLLGPPATTGETTMLTQAESVARAAGMNEPQIAKSLGLDRASYGLVRETKDRAELEAKLRELVQSSELGATLPAGALDQQIHYLSSPWFRYFLDYDPLPAARQVKCPALLLGGEKDLLVPPEKNLLVLKKEMEEAGNKNVEALRLPGLNHGFQHSSSGLPTESRAIEETFAPVALNEISSWILRQAVP